MRIRLHYLLPILALATFASAAFGREGDWGSSGGGEFLRDALNPWFVKNVTQVRYCVVVDREGFSSSAEKAKQYTAQAIQYWKKEFQSRDEILGIGSQTFVLTNPKSGMDCIGDEDLRVQFGYRTLSPEQLKRFTDQGEDPQDYLGIAIRTSYDKEQMRGKGYVFISSDKGPYPYNRGAGISRNLWSHDGLLFRILQHELGHVFGVSHTDTGFMSSDFPEHMVRNYSNYRIVQETPFFSPPDKFEFVSMRKTLPLQNMEVLQIQGSRNWREMEIRGFSTDSQEVYFAKAANLQRSSTRQHFPVRVFLPKEQKVFNALPGELVWKGPARIQFKLIGKFELKDGTSTSLLLELSPEDVEIYKSGESLERWL